MSPHSPPGSTVWRELDTTFSLQRLVPSLGLAAFSEGAQHLHVQGQEGRENKGAEGARLCPQQVSAGGSPSLSPSFHFLTVKIKHVR